MSTVSRGLPERPHLDVPKREARELLKAWRAAEPDALDRIRRRHPRFSAGDERTIAAEPFRLSDAQLVIAREYGFAHWTELKQKIDGNTLTGLLRVAIHQGDCAEVVRILRAHPHLLHVPVWSGNWGPPMSHAANLGQLEIIQAVAALGARDFQHAFDRALLQGRIECARWLHARGAKLAPGIVMGSCETLNPDGLRFLAELKAPFTNDHGSRLAPLAMVLETYGRHAPRKHAVLDLLEQQGCVLPDTPMMAFHRGRTERLRAFLRDDPGLRDRRFTYREIYPPELGCADDGRSGLHGTPVGGTTLLHLAIDFEDHEIFELLLDQGADVNARASLDADGFGGHTPLFHAVVACGRSPDDPAIAQALLKRGADPTRRANLRKFLDWCETPRWHIARDVTPAEWARTFPEQGWVDREAMRVIEPATS